MFFNTSSYFEAITIAVGIPNDTSSAWLGPDNIPIFVFGNSSSKTSVKVFRVPPSKPLEQIITCWFVMYCLNCETVFLTNFDGVTTNTISVPSR